MGMKKMTSAFDRLDFVERLLGPVKPEDSSFWQWGDVLCRIRSMPYGAARREALMEYLTRDVTHITVGRGKDTYQVKVGGRIYINQRGAMILQKDSDLQLLLKQKKIKLVREGAGTHKGRPRQDYAFGSRLMIVGLKSKHSRRTYVVPAEEY